MSATVCEDLSAYVIAGRVKSRLPDPLENETAVRTPAQGVQDGVDAEALGFRRVFLAERFDLKDSGILLGGIAARTESIGVGTGVVAPGARHPMLLAAMGATLHAAYGERFVLGLGRGAPGHSIGGTLGFEAFADYCTILKRLWAGEKFEYDGPAGAFGQLGLADVYEGEPPEVWYGGFGLPRAAETIARTPAIDGLLLPAMLTPLGVSRAVEYVRSACEQAGRDPASVRICASVVTAPDLSDAETRALAHARAVTYLQPPSWGRSYEILNDWDPVVLEKLREHRQFLGSKDGLSDLKFHRTELAEPAQLVPDEWMRDCCGIGGVEDCVRIVGDLRAAGADEVTTYGSTPAQNAGLIAAWRERGEP